VQYSVTVLTVADASTSTREIFQNKLVVLIPLSRIGRDRGRAEAMDP